MSVFTPKDYLYDPSLLSKFNLGTRCELLKKDPRFDVRPLRLSDYDRGYLELLSQLTEVGKVTREQYAAQFEAMRNCPGTYYITVIVDKELDRIIGAATLFLERKFIHNCALRSRIEDVVVNQTYRGKQLGKCVVDVLINLANALGSYKLSLDCKDPLIKFYESLGFQREAGNANTLVIRLPGQKYGEPKL
uniref:Glucosamine 6-phosphate N-acetyltransferase n=1 Tax=Lynceus sp. MCZ IZ 141354 TaxID=1930659 RepID=A0A9N6ZG87_9CRUS|nr:EOG090X0FKI [Lynceus sp. MCZ IZ 141354]